MDQATPRYRSMRLPYYDYSQPGWYFVTICTQERKMAFGDVVDDTMRLNVNGELVQNVWCTLPERFPFVQLDIFVVMPNHIHGILILTDTHRPSPWQPPDLARLPEELRPSAQAKRDSHPVPGSSLGEVVRTFKGASTRGIRTTSDPTFAWQTRYYDHVICNPQDLDRIRAYIATNPARWAQDSLHHP